MDPTEAGKQQAMLDSHLKECARLREEQNQKMDRLNRRMLRVEYILVAAVAGAAAHSPPLIKIIEAISGG